MAYNATAFTDDDLPGLSAAELNKLGQGVTTAAEGVDTLLGQRGTPTGLAKLDADGDVVDAGGAKVAKASDVASVVRFDESQTLTSGQKAQVLGNLGTDALYAPSADSMALTRIERQARQKADTYNRRNIARFTDATVTTELWANTTAWAGTATVGSGRMYGSTNGLVKGVSLAAGARLLARSTVHVPAASTKYAFFGVNADTAGAAPSGATTNSFLFGISTNQLQYLQGSGVTGAVSNPFAAATVPAGDYDATIIIDENSVSLSLHTANPGQAIFSVSIQRSQMPGGAINNLVFSNNDATGTGITWGPVVIVNELTLPPKSAYSPGGVTLFGAGHPVIFNRRDPSTGIRHLIYLPDNYDPRVPSPVVLYLHEALAGHAGRPYTDVHWAGVLAAFNAAGYILVSSDNGVGSTGAGLTTPTAGQVPLWPDQYGHPRGLDDYAAVVERARSLFNTGPLFLFGLSQGGEFVQNVLASRRPTALGNVAAAASISPSTDLIAVSQLATYGVLIMAVWGATDAPTFAAAIAGFNPTALAASNLRGVPQRFYVALDDTTTPKSVQVDPMVAKLTGYVPETSVVTVASGGHLAAALYQGSDLVTFFNQYA